MSNKEIYYWSPFTNNVATINAVINSAYSFQEFSKGKYKTSIINALGEWDNYTNVIKNKRINLINLNNTDFLSNKNYNGYFVSRIIYLIIFLRSLNPLKKIIIMNKPEFLIIHLITSLPLFLFSIFNFKTKLILRISGLPKMNYLRKIFWKFALKNVYKITCPTNATREDLIKLNICENNKIFVLYDPIIVLREMKIKKKVKIDNKYNCNFIVSIGRLTKQKNHIFLIKCFKKILKLNSELKLFIIGSGEEKNNLLKKINELKLNDNVYLLGYIDNIYPILAKSKCFILPSLWEDPGFVIVEAASMNVPIISSNCKNGPNEILGNGMGGYLFETNAEEDFIKKFYEFYNDTIESHYQKKLIAKKNIRNFSLFRHYLNFKRLLN